MRISNNGQKRRGLIVCAGILLVIAVWLAGQIAGRTGVTDPRVRIVPVTTTEAARSKQQQHYQVVQRVMEGEVAATAERVQEATGLALAASLLVASELGQGRAPASVDQLATALLQRGMLPGFSSGQQPGTVVTSHGTFAIRYRRTPIGIEVVSLGNKREAGPAILIRMPGDERENESGIWLAQSLDEVAIPRPFAPSAEVIAVGWTPDALPPIQ